MDRNCPKCQQDHDQFRLLVNTKTIGGPSWQSRNLGPFHKAIKLDE